MRPPFDWTVPELSPEDLTTFEPHFLRIIQEFFLCDHVLLAADDQQVDQENIPERYVAGVVKARETLLPVDDAEGPILYVPLVNDEVLLGVAVLYGGKSNIFEQRLNRLVEKSDLVVKAFRSFKKAAIDPTTGLLNGQVFHESLCAKFKNADIFPESENTFANVNESVDSPFSPCFSLFLVEIYPRVRESGQALRYISRAGSHLNSLAGQYVSIYHLGSGIFALIWPGDNEDGMRVGNAILDWLKREHFVRVHIGIASAGDSDETPDKSAEMLLSQAWTAVEKARQRGPYSFCTYADPDSMDVFSLQAFPAQVVSWLKGLCRVTDKFGIALLHHDQYPEDAGFLNKAISLTGPDCPAMQIHENQAVVFLGERNEDGVRQWAEEFGTRIKKISESTFSMGLAVYPCKEFKKTDIPINACKALKHTEFFGPGTRTLFDDVTLNISGDVYYNDGYLSKAVRDYKLGLDLDPSNTNLMNSLGVAYAQMNRHNMAISLFEKVLAIDGKNFMALCNHGFSLLGVNKHKEAIDSFERAVVIDDTHFDLLLQLGRLYCQTGRYRDAVDILVETEKLHEGDHVDIGYGAVHRYLGEAYKELGDHRQAMVCLQRAVRHNPRDGAALSLLGEVYALAGEGKDIALSLCHQAVDLDDSQWEHWYRLGKVQFRLGFGPAAISSLKECLRRDQKNASAAFLLARVYDELGRQRHARKMYERVLRVTPTHKEAEEALQNMHDH